MSPALISKLLKNIQQKAFKNSEWELSGHSSREEAALNLLNNGAALEKIITGALIIGAN